MAIALLVEPRPDLLDQVRGDPAPLGRRVEADPVQPVAQRMSHPQRLLRLVAERVDEDDPGDVVVEVAVERLRRLDRVAEDQDQRVGHRARRAEAGEAGPGRRRRTDAAADDRGIVEDVGDVGVDVSGPERHDGIRRGRIDALAGRRGPARRLGQHPQDRRLVQPEAAIAGADPEDDLLGGDLVPVVERVDTRLGGVAFGEDVADEVLRLVDAAQGRVLAGEDLHRDEGVEALALHDAGGSREIDVGGVARQDLARRSRPDQAHQR